MSFRILLSIGAVVSVLYVFTAASLQENQQENSAPVVTIISPAKNGKVSWNSMVPYSIAVSDREDGKSEYDEISKSEVILTIGYLPDSSDAKDYLVENHKATQKSLQFMSTSTCFNCHAAKTKFIGPSFELIARRYSGNPGAVESLSKKVIAGSSGTWGDVKMPGNPEMQIDQARELVRWILENNTDPDKTFLVGLQGSIRTKEKPLKEAGKAVYILIATYTDHGHGTNQNRKQGKHIVVLKNIKD